MVRSEGMRIMNANPCVKTYCWLFSILNAATAFSQKILKAHHADDLQETARLKAADFLDLYDDTIFRCAYMYLHNLSHAEGVLQDTMIQYIRTKSTLENEDHEKASREHFRGKLGDHIKR